MEVRKGKARIGVDALTEFVHQFGAGIVATDGVVYAGTVAYGTLPVEIVDEVIDFGINMRTHSIQVGLTQKFTGVNGSFNGSLTYYWQARSEYIDFAGGTPTHKTGNYVNITGTLQKTVATLGTSEDTLSGYIDVGSLTHFPARFQLVVFAHTNPSGNGKMKNSSFIKVVGEVIPGT